MLRTFSLIILFLFLSSVVSAQGLQVSGTVSNAGNSALEDVEVQLLNSTKVTRTDPLGRFTFSNLQAGNYQLKVFAKHYKEQIIPFKITSKDVLLSITLNADIHQLKEVVVNDNHVKLRKQEESLNIEVVDADFIQRNLGGSLMKTLERLPGIQTIGIGSGQSKPLIRGLGFNRVVVVEKGVKHEGQQWGADHGLEIDQFAAGEIELLKGAASFMYGSDAIGGVINIKPNSIPLNNTVGGSVDLIGKTNNNLYGTSVNLYGRKENWFFDSRVTYQNYGDYKVPTDTVFVYDYAVRLHENRLRNTAGRETGLHLNTGYVSDHFRSTFHLSSVSGTSGFFANAHGLEPRSVDTELHDRSDRDILMPYQKVNHLKLINRSEYHLPGHKLQMELGYQRNFRQEFSQYVTHGYMPPIYPSDLAIPIELEREFKKQVYSFNLRDNISLNKHLITIGVNGEYQDNSIFGWSFLVPSFNQATAGAFVYDKVRLNDEVMLHGALRYDYGRLNMFKYQDWFDSEIPNGATTTLSKLTRAEDLTRTFNSLVWSAGLNYNLNQFSLKANVGKSFRMPIAKELAANGVNYHYFSFERGNPHLSPEKSYQADLSLGWTENRWSITLSPFYNYFSNYIYLNPTSQHDSFYGAGNQIFEYAQSKVVRYGGELQFKYEIVKGLSTEVLGEYLYSIQRSGDKKGFTLPFSPPPSALFNLTYEPGNNNGSDHQTFKDNYISIDYKVTGKQDNIVPPERKTAGYNIVNLQAGTKLSLYGQEIQFSVQAQNLMNTRYLNHTSFYRLISLPEAGRNIILSIKVPFASALNKSKNK